MNCQAKKMFISYDESLTILENCTVQSKATKKVYLMQSLGLILAENIIATNNNPEFLTSAMDGYAIKYNDQKLLQLKIDGINPAGSDDNFEVISGTCIKTFTGSLMPKGSDTLIPIENVTIQNGCIQINEEVPFGFATRYIGENYKQNEILIKSGSLIGFAEIGIMASLNKVQVAVFCKPIISIASTGSEILDLGEEKTNQSQIRSSNHLTLEAIAIKYGADVKQMGVVKDDKESICELIKSSLTHSDIVVTTGGVSVGDYDFVKDIIKDELDATLLFQGVNIKPGQHIMVAQKGDKFIVGLPGFAYSSTVTFILYVLPLIFKFRSGNEKLPIIKAILNTDIVRKNDKTIFEACNIRLIEGKYYIDFDGKKSGTSAILTNMLGSTGLMIQNVSKAPLNVGDLVDVIIL